MPKFRVFNYHSIHSVDKTAVKIELCVSQAKKLKIKEGLAIRFKLLMYSGFPKTECSVCQTERKSVRLSNVRISDVRFVRFVRSFGSLDRSVR